ncbi:hypothetical protein EDB83DRAFT_2340192 [Lactarius deliciosus]|nr:hypothetical protein EDB83DRAFT_2340192 [Lactarius deliciosus]
MDVHLPPEDIGPPLVPIHFDLGRPFDAPFNLLSNKWESPRCAFDTSSSSARSSVLSTPPSSPLCDTPTSEFDAGSLYLDPEQDYLGIYPTRPHRETLHPPISYLTMIPFANYTGARPLQPHYGSPTSPPHSRQTSLSRRTSASSPTGTVSGRQLRPAYTRPAFAPRPSHPSLHTLSQTDFNYPIKTRKGTLGARLPLEPWDVSAGRDRVSQAPSFHDLDHVTDHLHSSEYPLGPESYISVNEDLHAGDISESDDTAEALGIYKDTHVLDGEAQFLQSPVSPEFSPEENPHMFASLFEVLSTFSPSNRSSSEEFAPADILFDDDIIHPSPSKRFDLDGFQYSQHVDYFSMPGGFSEADSFQPGTSAGTIRPLVNSIISDGIPSPHPDDDDWSSIYGDYATPELDEADMFGEWAEDTYEAVDGNDHDNRQHRRAQGYGERRSSNGYSNDNQDQRQTSGGDGLHGNGRQGSEGGDRGGGGGDDRRKDERNWKVASAFSTPSDSESEESEEDTRHSTQQSHSATPAEVSSSGDDVPLAQSIPTALRAQRTIRKQRRRLRALHRQQQQSQRPERQQTPTQVLTDEALRHHTMAGSSTQHISAQPAPSSSRTARSRTRTLPSSTARPIVAEDLARRLRDIQDPSVSSSLLPKHQPSPSNSARHSDQPVRRPGDDHARIPSLTGPDRAIRPSRSATTVSRPTKQHDPFEASRSAPSAHKSSRRPQTSDGHGSSTTLFNSSVFQRVSTTAADTPDPSSHSQVVSKETKQVSWQQRVFVVDLQRFNTLTMSPSTTAKEVIDALERQGQLANWVGVGGWMLFEVSQDFGMERPIRHFEVVSDVINSWDKNKSVNLLVAKKTPLAPLLQLSAMPSSSPVFSTYVEWESKPRKWSKRWLELREQGLWLSKKDNGKDETFLCSLANFDAYLVTRTHKPPKPYVFAVKSTDNLSFFENAADYVHVFCCSEKDGKKWMETVLLARSYFINQDRNTLLVTGSRNVQQPLVQVSAPLASTAQAYTFEPGSLLAKR